LDRDWKGPNRAPSTGFTPHKNAEAESPALQAQSLRGPAYSFGDMGPGASLSPPRPHMQERDDLGEDDPEAKLLSFAKSKRQYSDGKLSHRSGEDAFRDSMRSTMSSELEFERTGNRSTSPNMEGTLDERTLEGNMRFKNSRSKKSFDAAERLLEEDPELGQDLGQRFG
jgi:hypothetical protein